MNDHDRKNREQVKLSRRQLAALKPKFQFEDGRSYAEAILDTLSRMGHGARFSELEKKIVKETGCNWRSFRAALSRLIHGTGPGIQQSEDGYLYLDACGPECRETSDPDVLHSQFVLDCIIDGCVICQGYKEITASSDGAGPETPTSVDPSEKP